MEIAVYNDVQAEVEQAARVWNRRWPSISAAEFRQQAWVLALEALPRHDPDRGPLRTMLGGALRQGLLNFAYRSRQPVSTPKKCEHRFVDRARYMGEPSMRLRSDVDLEAMLARIETLNLVDVAVETAIADLPDVPGAKLSAAERREAVRSVLLGKTRPIDLARRYGGKPNRWQHVVRKAYAVLRDTITLPRSDAR